MAKTKTIQKEKEKQNKIKEIDKQEEEEYTHEKDIKNREQEGAIIRTWGTGTGKRTMSLHIRKSYYTNLGWDIGDFLFMEPDFDKGSITIKKVHTEQLKRKR